MYDTRNCPILERTGDGERAGRCWYFCPDDVCPRHGCVDAALERYRENGKLTDENDHVRWFPSEKPAKKNPTGFNGSSAK